MSGLYKQVFPVTFLPQTTQHFSVINYYLRAIILYIVFQCLLLSQFNLHKPEKKEIYIYINTITLLLAMMTSTQD